MPLFVYEVLEGLNLGERFERLERVDAEPLAQHPETGVPIKRVFAPPSNSRRATVDPATRAARQGFSTYRRAGEGCWEKQAGLGPSRLMR